METLISSLTPASFAQTPDQQDPSSSSDASLAAWGSSGGFGNVTGNGLVGMEVPRVSDVSPELGRGVGRGGGS
jgi:hypothetical protein